MATLCGLVATGVALLACGQLMTFAGLYDTWHDKAEGKNVQSCAMVITEPNKLVAEVHDRMPVILERDQFDTGCVPTTCARRRPC